MEQEEKDVFDKYRELKKSFLKVKEGFQRDGKIDDNRIVIPIESWTKIAKDVGEVIIKASELLTEIVFVQEKVDQKILDLYKKKRE